MATRTGTSGVDVLYGGGPDTLIGLGGNDTYVVYSPADVVVETGAFDRDDRVLTFSSYVLNPDAEVEVLSTAVNAGTDPFFLIGNRFDQVLVGNYGNNSLDGRAGNDTLIGLRGDDVYRVYRTETIVEAQGEGFDIAYASGTYFLTQGASIEYLGAVDQASTTQGVALFGNELAQVIVGTNTNDTLRGGGGADTLIGLGGDDTYDLYAPGGGTAVISEAPGQGYDTVLYYGNFALAEGVSVEAITPAGFPANVTGGYALLGNGFSQVITGYVGADTLNGLGGADTLAGGRGDDVYRVYSQGDVVLENASEGSDLVFTSATYRLVVTSAVETLSTAVQAGTERIDLFGNGFAQTLIGNFGANFLDGAGGGDTLIGLAGDDTYRVYGLNDAVVEGTGGGTDIVYASGSFALGAGSAVEAISTVSNAGSEVINLTGNELAQTIVGNFGVNVLDGGAGADTLYGLAGADVFRFSTAPGGGNVDTLADFGNGADAIALDPGVFTGLPDGALPASAIALGAAAADADDRVIYNPATGALLWDADGTGATAALQFAALPTGLAASQILVRSEGSYTATIGDVQSAEGNSGTTAFTFTVTLDRAATGTLSLAYATLDGTALAGQDFATSTGTLTFAAGQRTASATVAVTGDTVFEAAETFRLQITGGALVSPATATGTIVNDDFTARINAGGTYSFGGATGGIALETAFPGATEYVFGPESPGSLPRPHTILFGPGSYAPGHPTITVSGVGGGASIAAFDFTQLGMGLVVRNGAFGTAAGQNILTLDVARSNFNGDPQSIVGGAFGDVIDRSDARLNGGSDGRLFGSIQGGAGNDTLIGAAAQDGGEGDDRLVGGINVQMTGGAGADTFALPIRTRTPGTNSQSSPNMVVDFTPGQDRIELVLNITTDLAPGALDPSRFAIGAAATTPDQRIIYDPASGRLLFDATGSLGDPTGSIPLFAQLAPGLDLTAANFTIALRAKPWFAKRCAPMPGPCVKSGSGPGQRRPRRNRPRRSPPPCPGEQPSHIERRQREPGQHHQHPPGQPRRLAVVHRECRIVEPVGPGRGERVVAGEHAARAGVHGDAASARPGADLPGPQHADDIRRHARPGHDHPDETTVGKGTPGRRPSDLGRNHASGERAFGRIGRAEAGRPLECRPERRPQRHRRACQRDHHQRGRREQTGQAVPSIEPRTAAPPQARVERRAPGAPARPGDPQPDRRHRREPQPRHPDQRRAPVVEQQLLVQGVHPTPAGIARPVVEHARGRGVEPRRPLAPVRALIGSEQDAALRVGHAQHLDGRARVSLRRGDQPSDRRHRPGGRLHAPAVELAVKYQRRPRQSLQRPDQPEGQPQPEVQPDEEAARAHSPTLAVSRTWRGSPTPSRLLPAADQYRVSSRLSTFSCSVRGVAPPKV
jgi:Ca2+-binding RTX toxin-like protein